jgi:hypothetical protein
MGYRHAAVWSDDQEARIFRIEPGSFDAAELEAPTHHLHERVDPPSDRELATYACTYFETADRIHEPAT